MNRTRALAVAAALIAGLLVPALTQQAQADPPTFHSADGLTVVSATPDGSRTWRLVVSTSALSQPVRVDVLLPERYAASSARYPVLYLFHGTSGGADDWINDGNATAATDPYPLIVVMPDAGYNDNGGSWFTNWVDQKTPLGTANWETFDINQLIPWIDDNLRTVATRDGRAVAGLSQGGFGAMTYAARHPDTFISAGSFSGAPDIASNPVVQAGAAGIIDATEVGLDKVEPDAMFGDPVADDINWQGHDPATLVTNLGHTTLDLWSGNGIPGPLDTPSVQIVPDALIEGAAHTSTTFFAQAASAAHIAYTLDNYGNGTHSWPYWTRDLAQYLPLLMATFASAPAAPASISYRSVDVNWTQWGWSVDNVRRAAQAFSGLVNASATGFTFASPSPAEVTTPGRYTPGATYRLKSTGGSVNGRTSTTVVASPTGTIQVRVAPALLHSSVTVSIAAA
jgi:S-formylglutathione hydrolase FrmB